MMDTSYTTRPRRATLSAAPLSTRQFMPAAIGVCAAVVLAGSGFGLGCLYVVLSAPAAAPSAALVAPVSPVGGPEDVAPPDDLAVSQARLPEARNEEQVPAISRPVAGGWVSSRFGPRPDPFTGLPAVHRGLDFAGIDNSPILAVASGVVTRSGRQPGYGNLIEIDHGRGWISRYGHNAFNLVTPGDYVRPGQTIALMGATGRATGTHLHFEILYRGHHQNPARYVPQEI